MTDLIANTADLLASYDAGVASVFRTQPFNRVTVSQAFLRGCTPDTLAAQVGWTAVRVALADQAARSASC